MKSDFFWIVILVGVVVVSAVVGVFIWRGTGDVVRVYKDGVLVEVVDLSAVTEVYTIPLVDEVDERGMLLSGINMIDVDTGRIRMGNADCRSKMCVRQGWVSSGPVPIVCLPNRVVIVFDSGFTNTDVDAIVG